MSVGDLMQDRVEQMNDRVLLLPGYVLARANVGGHLAKEGVIHDEHVACSCSGAECLTMSCWRGGRG
jgi:hypothetical protein